MPIEKLTERQVDRLLTRPGLHGDGGGVYLRITKSGARLWSFVYKRDGRRREMGLGGLGTFNLREVRARARQYRQMLYDGLDPITERRRQEAALERAKSLSFKECAERYIAHHQAAWKNPKHRAQWPSTLVTYAYPTLGGLPVRLIDTALVVKVLEPIWALKPETASRVRGRIEAVLDWAKAQNWRDGDNPARWKGALDQVLPKKAMVARASRRAKGKGEHFAAMPYRALPDFMVELAAREGAAARALEFTILTAKRTDETLGACWREISVADGLWTIPAGRMKNEREHRVPLNAAALALLDQVQPPCGGNPDAFIFPGGKAGWPLSNMSMLMLLQRRMNRAEYTVHGFRSTFRDWVEERTDLDGNAAKMALAHVVTDKVEAAYRRGDLFEKRRQMAEAWARFCRSGSTAVALAG